MISCLLLLVSKVSTLNIYCFQPASGYGACILIREHPNIREIREQRGIYQDDLAAAIGFSTKTVGRIEHGDSTPSAEFMLRISKYFNLLVEDVFHVEY